MNCETNASECKQPDSCAERGCFTDRVRSLKFGEDLLHGTKNLTAPSQMAEPSYEKGVAGEERPGGGFMPYLNPGSGSSMPIKEANEQKHRIKDIRDRQRNAPSPA